MSVTSSISSTPTPNAPRGTDGPRRVLFMAMQLDGGGVTTHMMTLAQGLMKQGIEVALASRGSLGHHDMGPGWFEAHGVKYFHVPFPIPSAPLRLPLDALKTRKAMANVVASYRPDLLHLHCRSASPYARLIEHQQGIPFIATHHSLSLSTNLMYRICTFWAASIICVSAESARFLTCHFDIHPDRITIIPHGIDTAHFRLPTETERLEAREAYGLEPDAFAIALIGNLNAARGDAMLARKGHDVLVRALARLREGGIRPAVLLAGRGDPAPVQALAAKCGVLDQVRPLGHQEARRVLWASDVLVLPSNKEESFGLVVIEAMCCGVPVIRSATGGHEEQIRHGLTGFTFPQTDNAALAHHLRHLFTHPDACASVASAGHRAAHTRFAQAQMVDAVRDVYAGVLGRKGRG